jgi:hypothetical protein
MLLSLLALALLLLLLLWWSTFATVGKPLSMPTAILPTLLVERIT